jgi:hypothetical protein
MRLVHAACFVVVATLSAPAAAQDETAGYAAPDPDSHLSPESHGPVATPDVVPVRADVDDSGRVKTHFLVGLGLLALPAADVCPFVQADCEPGETGLAVSLATLGEVYDFAFGAGITLALGLKPSEAVDPDGTLEREHGRSYFLVEAQFHYFLPTFSKWNWWVGGSGGAAIVNDSWTTIEDREPYDDTSFVGPRAVTLATEGLALGIGAGGHWMVTEHWLFGTQLRYSNWFFPSEREVTPVGDSASLAGRIDVVEVGVFGGFRIPL